MIFCKTKEEIAIMQHGGHILAEVVKQVMDAITVGVSEYEIEKLAERLIREKGAEPGFQKVPGYKYATCISTNDVVVHGIPGKYRFKEGDVVGVDCGVFYQGFYTDMSDTKRIITKDTQPDAIDTFLAVGKKALKEAINVAVVGNRVGHISQTIQDIVEGSGYSVVRTLIGHGVGRELHEEPEIPGFLNRKIEKTPLLQEGMTIAIEIIYNMGKKDVVLDADGWTIKTADRSISGLFEKSIAVTKKKPLILT